MTPLHLSGVEQPCIAEQVGDFVTATFESSVWQAQELGEPHRSMWLDSASSEGIAVYRADLLPIKFTSEPFGSKPTVKYYAYVISQPHEVSVDGVGTTQLQPDVIVILRSDVRCQVAIPKAFTTSAFIIDRDMFESSIPDFDRFIGRKLVFPFHLDRMMRGLMDTAWAIADAGRLREAAPKLSTAFLSLLSLLGIDDGQEHRLESDGALDIRRAQVKAFIDRHYACPDISISSIASRLHISPRYIRMAFARDDTPASEYLRKRRLEASAKYLADPRQRKKGITEVAFACGYNSASHFASEFKRNFGLSPREFRAAQVDD